MAKTQVPCSMCGQPAIVHISNVVSGRQIRLDLCMACADRRSRKASEAASRFRFRMSRSEIGVMLIAIGLFVLSVSALADVLQFGKSAGFGWQQNIGLALAAVLMLIGSLFGVMALVVVGVFVGTVTLLADYLGFGNSPGFGVQQIVGCVLGAVFLGAGLLMVRRPFPRHGAAAPPPTAPNTLHFPPDGSTHASRS